MSKKLFHITAYYFGEEMPTEYPVPLRIDECEVDSSERVNDFYNKACDTTQESADGGLFCMRVQEYEKNKSGGLMRRDDEIKMGMHPYYTYGCYDDNRRFSYGDIVEVIDGDLLTLGIIIHVPRALREQRLIIVMPSWYYKYDVMVYKADGTVSHMELTEAQMIHGRGIIARPIVKALRESRGTVCIREYRPGAQRAGQTYIGYGFNGHIAEDEVRNKYINKSIAHKKVKGLSNPISYKL